MSPKSRMGAMPGVSAIAPRVPTCRRAVSPWGGGLPGGRWLAGALLTVAAIDMLTSKARHRLIGLEGKS